MLTLMLQETAVNEKQLSEQLQQQLEVALAEGAEKTAAVNAELAEVEPAVAEAQNGSCLVWFPRLISLVLQRSAV